MFDILIGIIAVAFIGWACERSRGARIAFIVAGAIVTVGALLYVVRMSNQPVAKRTESPCTMRQTTQPETENVFQQMADRERGQQ